MWEETQIERARKRRWKQTLTFNGLYWSKTGRGSEQSRQWRESKGGRKGRVEPRESGKKEGQREAEGGGVSERRRPSHTARIFLGSSHGT